MASPSTSATSAAPYYEFQKQGPQELPNWTSEGERALHDHDGAVLHETEYSGLLRAIIKRNDVLLLSKCLAIHPASLGPGETWRYDPFWTATAHGSTDALDIMLQHWNADPSRTLAPDARGFRLLHVACAHAKLHTARFLIDEQRPWASRFGDGRAIATERDALGQTAILSAAARYRDSQNIDHDDLEVVIRLLLCKGARATDTTRLIARPDPKWPTPTFTSNPMSDQPLNTVLSLAVPGASAEMIGSLVDGGADVHLKTRYVDTNGLFGETHNFALDVTPLHIASMFANADGVQALHDRRGDDVAWRDMVSRTDSHGRLPLHWAAGGAGGPWAQTKDIPHDILRTMELLLDADAASDAVSCTDAQGDTLLHYIVRSSSASPEINYQVAKFLCEKGARAGTRGSNGQTPLHCLICTHAARPSSGMMALCKLLLAHGANVGDEGADGNTVLHLAARAPQHLETLRLFLDDAGAGRESGARDLLLCSVNAQGDTPLHVAATGRWWLDRNQPVEEHIRSQDALMRMLTPECRADVGHKSEQSLLDQPNRAGKTPKQLCEEIRRVWRKEQDAQPTWAAGVGRGNGRGRGLSPVAPSLPDSPW